MERSLTVIFDGWSLAHRPSSPGAVHLWALLENIPAGVEAILALPAPIAGDLAPQIKVEQIHTAETAGGQLRWEQCTPGGCNQASK